MSQKFIEFAQNEFELAQPVPDGTDKPASLRDHYKKQEQGTRKRIERLHRKCPEGFEYLWSWYIDLKYGEPAVTLGLIESWSRLNKIELTNFELKMIRALERARLEAQK